jgi:alpha-L-fucosidase 2
MKARGGFEIDITWKNKQVTQLTIRSSLGGNCIIKTPNTLQLTGKQSLKKAKNFNAYEFQTVKGGVYVLKSL